MSPKCSALAYFMSAVTASLMLNALWARPLKDGAYTG